MTKQDEARRLHQQWAIWYLDKRAEEMGADIEHLLWKSWQASREALLREFAAQPEAPSLRELQEALDDARDSADWYKRRCDLLQTWQSKMRDPERTIVCDILANGQTLPDPDGNRYGLPPSVPTRCHMGVGCDESGVCYAEAMGKPERCAVRPCAQPEAQPAVAAMPPTGFALVPLRMNAEMRRVVDSGEWDWPDLLAAAESITEADYNALSAEAAQPGQEPDWLHLKPYGYAPGNYMSRCHSCNQVVQGVDKRAVCCRPCAERLHAAPAPAQEPFGWVREWDGDDSDANNWLFVTDPAERDGDVSRWQPVYLAAPMPAQEREPISDDKIRELIYAHLEVDGHLGILYDRIYKFARAVLAADRPAREPLTPLTDNQMTRILHEKHFDPKYELTQSDRNIIEWWRIGVRDGERAHGIGADRSAT